MNHVYMAQSLDGFIAGPKGELGWLEDIENPEYSDLGFSAFMHSIDALVMGRNTFETVLSFGEWPYEKPVYVVSAQLTDIPKALSDKAFIVSGTPAEIVAALHQKGLKNLYIDGGKLVQSFLNAGLINQLTITTLPIILSDGIPLFDNLTKSTKLTLKSSEVLLNQLVKTTYLVE